jgi:hypothetical protein
MGGPLHRPEGTLAVFEPFTRNRDGIMTKTFSRVKAASDERMIDYRSLVGITSMISTDAGTLDGLQLKRRTFFGFVDDRETIDGEPGVVFEVALKQIHLSLEPENLAAESIEDDIDLFSQARCRPIGTGERSLDPFEPMSRSCEGFDERRHHPSVHRVRDQLRDPGVKPLHQGAAKRPGQTPEWSAKQGEDPFHVRSLDLEATSSSWNEDRSE